MHHGLQRGLSEAPLLCSNRLETHPQRFSDSSWTPATPFSPLWIRLMSSFFIFPPLNKLKTSLFDVWWNSRFFDFQIFERNSPFIAPTVLFIPDSPSFEQTAIYSALFYYLLKACSLPFFLVVGFFFCFFFFFFFVCFFFFFFFFFFLFCLLHFRSLLCSRVRITFSSL